MTDLTQQLAAAGWRRDPRTGDWSHATHGKIERDGNRWRVTGHVKPFLTLREAANWALSRQREVLFA